MSPTQLQGKQHHVPKLVTRMAPLTPNWLQLPQLNTPGGTQLPLTIGCREVNGHCEVELGPEGVKWPWGDTCGFGVEHPWGHRLDWVHPYHNSEHPQVSLH